MIQIDPHTDKERDTLLHMLGLGLAGRKRVSHRNYFAADPDSEADLMLHSMAQAGLVRLFRRPSDVFPYNFFTVTEEGKDAVRRFFGEFRKAKS